MWYCFSPTNYCPLCLQILPSVICNYVFFVIKCWWSSREHHTTKILWQKKSKFAAPVCHVRTGPESISTAVVSGFHTQAHYGRRDSSAAQVGWSCSAQHQASQHQHSAELSCKLSAEWLLFFTLYKCSGVGDGWGAWWCVKIFWL